jgi:glycosyltransferase involved in cell wall biosynthesis
MVDGRRSLESGLDLGFLQAMESGRGGGSGDVHFDVGQRAPVSGRRVTRPVDDVWIVIAAFNEGAVIAEVVGELRTQGWRVLVVDDGSSDATAARAREAGAMVLEHAVNLGQGAALQTGIDYALTRGCRRVVTFDADGQHRPEDIPSLLAALDEGAEVALGSRFLGRMEGATRFHKMFLRVAVVTSNVVSGLRLTDAHCGLRAFRSEVAIALRMTQDRMAHASQILRNIARNHLKVEEVPVTIHYTARSRRRAHGVLTAFRILFDYFFRQG